MLEEFADVALGIVAKRVGRDGVGDVHGIALIHDGFGVTLAFGGDGEGLEFHGAIGHRGARRGGILERAQELEVFRDGDAGGDIDGGGDFAITGVGHLDGDATGGHGREAVEAFVLGDGGLAAVDDAHLGVAEIFAGGGIEDLADDGAGGRLGEGRQRGEERGTDEGEQGANRVRVHGIQVRCRVRSGMKRPERETEKPANERDVGRCTGRLQARHIYRAPRVKTRGFVIHGGVLRSMGGGRFRGTGRCVAGCGEWRNAYSDGLPEGQALPWMRCGMRRTRGAVVGGKFHLVFRRFVTSEVGCPPHDAYATDSRKHRLPW
jgi:hypothetical protein